MKIKPIYEKLYKLGLKTTIAVWIFRPSDVTGNPDPEEQLKSATLEDQEYFAFIREYKNKGFEIALHTVTSGNDKREETLKGYSKFNELFTENPKINIMHSKNLENIYWGQNTSNNLIIRFLVKFYDKRSYEGESTKSRYFWGDICKDKTKYVRLWGTNDINTLKFNPSMPYHDSSKPYVNYWFSFSDGYTAKYFNQLLSEKNIKKLVKERGTAIIYTHFAADFTKKNLNGTYVLNTKTKNLLELISAQKQGWFMPVGEILDRLLQIKNVSLHLKANVLTITNNNADTVTGLTLITKPFIEYLNENGTIAKANQEGEIILGDLYSGGKKWLTFYSTIRIQNTSLSPAFFENLSLILEKTKILIFSHHG